MPTKKPRERDEDGKFVSEKAVVSELGVNDTPEPTEPKVVKTKNGNTINILLLKRDKNNNEIIQRNEPL